VNTYWKYGSSPQKTMGMATREAYGKALVELGKENPDVVVLDADLSKSTYTGLFAKAFPDRHFNVGIAEANMVGIASGFTSYGKIPFISSFAAFLMCKGFDQLRMTVAYPNHPVKVVTTHAGISLGEDGPSQQSVEDLALACALPHFVVTSPADETATRALVKAAADYPGPVYIRTGRPKAPKVYDERETFDLTGAKRLSDGKDVAIIAHGLLVAEAVEAAERLAKEGIEASVVDAYCLKPLPGDLLLQVAEETGAVVVAEEHLLHGGLGSRVAQWLAEKRPTPLAFIGINDTYAESGKPDELMKRYGLSADKIIEKAKALLDRKRTPASATR